jgi:hypothetical protein
MVKLYFMLCRDTRFCVPRSAEALPQPDIWCQALPDSDEDGARQIRPEPDGIDSTEAEPQPNPRAKASAERSS